MSDRFETPGTNPKPRTIGRVVRIVSGLMLLGYLIGLLVSYGFQGKLSPLSGILTLALCLAFLPELVNAPFGRRWGSRPRWVAAGLILAAGVLDLARTGSVFGPFLSRFVYLLVLYVISLAGLSFLLAGLFAVPG